MPPQYKTFRNRRSNQVALRKPPSKPMRYKVADTAYKAFQAAMYVKRLINVEFKHADYSRIGHILDSGGQIDWLNDSNQGATDTSHNGDSILNKQTSFRGKLQRGTADSVVRLIFFRDKTNSMTVPIMLTNTGTALAPHSTIEKDHRANYTIMKDITYTLDSGRPSLSFDIELQHTDHTKFNAGTNTINSNAHRVLMISDQVPGPGAAPSITYMRRASFVDN